MKVTQEKMRKIENDLTMIMKMELLKRKNATGITLIALVVTIVILLILSGITINMLLGESGIIKTAQEAKNTWETAVTNEQENMNELLKEITRVINDGAYVDEALAVPPKLSQGMIPVKYDENNKCWIKTTKKDSEWYNYNEKEWANVVLADAVFNEAGILNEQEPYTMFVWIPRYAYKIVSGWHSDTAGTIDIVFINQDNKDKNGNEYNTTYANAIKGISVGQGMNGYVVHPAFNFGNKELDGFWAGKYETSNVNCTTEEATGQYNNTDVTVQIKAGVTSWRNINVSNIYTVCTELNKIGNVHGLSTNDKIVDPHMMKNLEWGACAYLSNSKYGKQNEEVWINNSSRYITGAAGNAKNADTDVGTTDDYKSIQGQKASTSGNVYGIYDMNGGSFEYVAGYVNNNNENLQLNGANLIAADDRYKDIYNDGGGIIGNYANTSNRYGDAIYEVSANSETPYTSSWFNDYSYFPDTSLPFLVRGGFYYAKDNAGLYCFGYDIGQNYPYDGFRIALSVL